MILQESQKDSNPEFTQRPVWSELRVVTAADLWGPFQTSAVRFQRTEGSLPMISGFVRCDSSSELWCRLNKGTPLIRCSLACCWHFANGKMRSTLQTGNPPLLMSFPAKKIQHQLCLTTPFHLWDSFLCSSSQKNVIVPIKGFPLIPPQHPH